MFSEVDDSLRELLIADLPIERSEVDISFDRPTREWSSRLSRPTLNLFLIDIRERADMRDMRPAVAPVANGRVTKTVPARRMDLAYMVTAWTKEAADEHRILARVLGTMFRHGRIPAEHLRGALKGGDHEVLLRMAKPDHVAKPHELWGVLDNEIRASLMWIATAPLEVFAPVEGALVRTAEISVLPRDEDDAGDRFLRIAGIARRKGDPEVVVAGARVGLAGTGAFAVTDARGRYQLGGVRAGEFTLRVELPDGAVQEVPLRIPSDSYDVEIE